MRQEVLLPQNKSEQGVFIFYEYKQQQIYFIITFEMIKKNKGVCKISIRVNSLATTISEKHFSIR